MNASMEALKAQSLSAATAWWDGRPFPRNASGDPYLCSLCGLPIWHREGTALLDVRMLCPDCTQQRFESAASTNVSGRPPGAAPTGGPVGGEVNPADRAVPSRAESVPTPNDLPPVAARLSRLRGPTGVVTGLAVVAVITVVLGLLWWAPWKPPAPPGDVRVTATTPTTATLTWTPRSNGVPVTRYMIVRDKNTAGWANGTATSFVDSGLVPGGSYSYQVVAARGSNHSRPSASTATAVTVAPAPSGLQRVAVTTDSVTLSWTAPADSPAPDEYVIVVDGKVVASISGNPSSGAPTYQARNLHFGTLYGIQVKAVWRAGGRSQPSPTLQITTPNPPLTDARLEDAAAVVQFKMTSSAWPDMPVGKTFTGTWALKPTCATGPCNVLLTGTFSTKPNAVVFQMTLARHGATYSGQTTANISKCGGVTMKSKVVVTLTVETAAGPEWNADRWTGTIESRSSYTKAGGNYYCPAGRSVATVSSVAFPGV